jgi:NMD protein affecting ribosome stability and mRNA decay
VRCANCGRPLSGSYRGLCQRCTRSLPTPTRTLWLSREITLERAVELLRVRYSSVRSFGGGRRR